MLYEKESHRPIDRKKAIYSLDKLRELLKLSPSYYSSGVGGQESGRLSSVHNLTYASKGQMRSQDFHPSKVVKGCPTLYLGGVNKGQARNQDFHSHLIVTRHSSSSSPLEYCQRCLVEDKDFHKHPSGKRPPLLCFQ